LQGSFNLELEAAAPSDKLKPEQSAGDVPYSDMSFEGWCLLLGGVMLAIVFSDILLRKLPVTAAMLYLLLGFVLGPVFLRKIELDPWEYSPLLERLSEGAVIVSLFTAGLKLPVKVRSKAWRLPLRLASLSMIITVALTSIVSALFFDLSWGAAILLGAILAPTDPVLASEVQVNDPEDRDKARFSLTGEAGFNDGSAFPFVMLGLGLLGKHELGIWGMNWLLFDVGWAICGGLAAGWIAGLIVGRFLLYVRDQRRERIDRDEFIALGLIGLSYGAATLMHTYGFLAVFAAALSFRRQEAKELGMDGEAGEQGRPGRMHAVLRTNEQLERVLELGLALATGAMLSGQYFSWHALWFAPMLFFIIRPLSTLPVWKGSETTFVQKAIISWFGIRGIGSLYYLFYAMQHGLEENLARLLAGLALSVVAISIIAHGISVTPVMEFYRRLKPGRENSST
jgi:NhaP-type Na+/H+ or K+/H+ antiporter